MANLIFIAFLLAVGAGLRKIDLGEGFNKNLNDFLIYVTLPAIALLNIPKISIDEDTILVVILAWVIMAISALLTLFITKGYDSKIRACLLLVVTLGNTSFIAIPILKTILGDESLSYILIYDQFGTFLALSIFGSFVVGVYEHGKVNWQEIGKKIIKFPPFIAIIAAFIIGDLPDITKPYLVTLSNTLTPLAMISVGYVMRLNLGAEKLIFFKAMFLKMAIIPAIAFALALLCGLDGIEFRTVVLEAGMPSMVTAGILAMRHNFAPLLASSMVGYGVLFSLFSVPLINYIITLLGY